MIGPLGEWVMRTAMHQLNAWESKGHAPPRVALNISSVQVKLPDFVEGVKRALAETGADARRFDLELTEGILLECSPETLSAIAELKSLGFELAIDDFGAGHASLQYLRNFPIDKIKIDQIFVRQLVDGLERCGDHPRHHLAGPQPQARTGGGGDRDRRAARYPARAGLHDRAGLFLQPAARGGGLRLDDRARERAAGQPRKQTKSRRSQGAEAIMMRKSARPELKPPKADAGVRAQKIRKKPTGIAGFDQITDGGLPEGRLTAVIGAPGMGKSLFAMQNLLNRLADSGRAGALRDIRGIDRSRAKQPRRDSIGRSIRCRSISLP